MQEKILFIDRDGTLIIEPNDKQIDSIEKLDFLPGVFQALKLLQKSSYKLVMVSNQDGLGTMSLPQENFSKPHDLMLKIFKSQGIVFDDIKICPHFSSDACKCRKPKIGLLLEYVLDQRIDKKKSFVIGDRQTDMELANTLGIQGILIGGKNYLNWEDVTQKILNSPRLALIQRKTKETDVKIALNLDQPYPATISTGINFLNHMLEQIAKHANVGLNIEVQGDIEVDDHHTIEDTAIALGQAFQQALGDKRGCDRYGFILPMDEALATVAIDLSGRSFFQGNFKFERDTVGDMATEMVSHFFRSFSDGLQATLHIKVEGENTHHKVEAAFKGLGRALKQAIKKDGLTIPSTKGQL